MVVFTSNHCPTAHSIEQRLERLWEDYRPKGLKLVAINPNNPEGLSPDELGFGEFGDSFAEMKPYAEKNHWTFDYLYDGDQQKTARAYGCLATPHVFIFDQDLKLRYAGRFDDSHFYDESTVKSKDAQNAVDAILAGKPVSVELTKPHGCSTKWIEKKTANVAKVAAWDSTPVKIETIDVAGINSLRTKATGNYRLINVWATWCVPCVHEFPDLVSISRQFDMRQFEFVSISMDQPSSADKVQAFLCKQGAGLSKRGAARLKAEGRPTNSYLFAGSIDDLAKALDPEMPGPIPHTLLLDPDGKIVWRHNGPIDHAETVTAILDQLGRGYSRKKG